LNIGKKALIVKVTRNALKETSFPLINIAATMPRLQMTFCMQGDDESRQGIILPDKNNQSKNAGSSSVTAS